VSFGCVVVVVVLFGCVGWIGFFFLFIVLESGLTGFFLKYSLLLLVCCLGWVGLVCGFVFVMSVFGLFVFVECVWVVGFCWVVRFDLGGRPSGPP
jgi:hypothetical protein